MGLSRVLSLIKSTAINIWPAENRTQITCFKMEFPRGIEPRAFLPANYNGGRLEAYGGDRELKINTL